MARYHQYCSKAHFTMLRDILIKGGEPTLTAAKVALESIGVAWPTNYNSSQEPHIVVLDDDLSEIFYQMRKSQSATA